MASILRPCALLSLALGALASPLSSTDDPANNGPQLFARASCKDNLGRCFNPTGTKATDIASRSLATAFCSSYLSIPVVTSTITTTTPHTAITVTATVTASTETDTTTSTEDVVETDTVSTTVTTILTTTASATSSDAPEKRALSTAPLPACATGLAYSPSQFSSACACVAATPSTTYVTGTAPVATDTSISTSSVTTTTITVTTSTVTTGTTTETDTAVVTETPSPPAPLCSDAPNPYIVNGEAFTVYCDTYYYGAGEIARTTGIADYSDCIAFCTETPGCVYGYWVASNSGYGDKLYCYAFNQFTPALLHAASGVDAFSLDS